MGLGLAIVQRAARMLDRRVKLKSVPGQGSVFRFALPLATPLDHAPPAPASVRRRTTSGQSVLVIDNEPAILEGMAAMLGGWGCEVTGARSAEEALRAVDAGLRPNLIIADYHLDAGATGEDAALRARARLGFDVPVIVITADRMPELRDRLQALGFDCLTKPVKPAQLRALLNRPENERRG